MQHVAAGGREDDPHRTKVAFGQQARRENDTSTRNDFGRVEPRGTVDRENR
ncbi:hypothetical protein ZHAS_00017319 [Anopheles sinensis]|uniref:Uncharacterized protein n=1 Tax=Anopheles sinensis TaxID=74873 RepID=A0A084WG18_ANOSI|nr:hypothetical protein ZHAS_00017319 [Anopheles sinensis]